MAAITLFRFAETAASDTATEVGGDLATTVAAEVSTSLAGKALTLAKENPVVSGVVAAVAVTGLVWGGYKGFKKLFSN